LPTGIFPSEAAEIFKKEAVVRILLLETETE